MKCISLVAALGLTLACFSAGAAPRDKLLIEKSPDVLAPRQLAKKPALARVAAPLVLAPELLAAAAVTSDDVGDADSFGRNVTYLGLAQTMSVAVMDDCSGSDPAFERCVVAQPPPLTTTFNESDLATMHLPGKATKSLICFTLTPNINAYWQNYTASQQVAQFSATALITIENDVLNDPALLDPNTGLPFGGSLELGLSTWHKNKSIDPGEFEDEISFQTRACIAGIVNRKQLIEGYGFTPAQATNFFKKPMTIRFGARGSVAMAQFAQYFYGIRLYGD